MFDHDKKQDAPVFRDPAMRGVCTVTLQFDELSDSTYVEVMAQLADHRARREAQQREIRAIRADGGVRRGTATIEAVIVYKGKDGELHESRPVSWAR